MTLAPSSVSSSRVWSAYQLAFYRIIAEGKGHVVLLARAGCAKTTSAVESLNYLPKGASCLFVAFNKDIATELENRVPKGVEASTTHKFGFAQVRRGAGRVTIEKNKTYIILDNLLSKEDSEKTEWVAALVRTVSLAKGALAASPTHIDRLMDAFEIDLNNASADDAERVKDRAKFIAIVIDVLKHAANTSFHLTSCKKQADRAGHLSTCKGDDRAMCNGCGCSGCNFAAGIIDFDDMIWLPIVRDFHIAQYDYVYIDEAQDLNPAQIELSVRACAYPNGRVIAVGDDRQAIYGFRGADTQAIHGLVKRLGAKVMPLPVTYRCSRAVVALAKQFVPDLEAAPNASEGSVRDLSWNRMVAMAGPGDFILSRSNAPLIGLCMSFLAEGRRATIQGRDLAKNLTSTVKRSRQKDVEGFLMYLDKWESAEKRRMLAAKPVPGDPSAVEDKAMCLRTLCEGAQSLSEVLARIEGLFSDEDNMSRIVLSTTHKAKGLERDNVFVLRGTYGKLDSEEAENLFYVAVTRARETLHLVADKPKAA